MSRSSSRAREGKASPLATALFILLSLALAAGLVFGAFVGVRAIQRKRAADEAERERLAQEDRERRDRAAYPLGYEDLLRAAGRTYDLPFDLLLAVVRTESSFRPSAVSPAGAVGLMQMTPGTFAWLCEKRGQTHEEEELTDPALNIDYGAYYLRLLLDYYDGCLDNALCAYNAGIGSVNGWLEEEGLPRGGALSQIPFEETRNYLSRVKRARAEYNRIYGDALAADSGAATSGDSGAASGSSSG